MGQRCLTYVYHGVVATKRTKDDRNNQRNIIKSKQLQSNTEYNVRTTFVG